MRVSWNHLRTDLRLAEDRRLKLVEKAVPEIGMDEEERIGRIVAGDGSAFAELVREFYPLAYGLAHRVLLDTEDAEEVVRTHS